MAYTMQIPSSALPGIAGWNGRTFMHFPLAPLQSMIFAALIFFLHNKLARLHRPGMNKDVKPC